MTAIAAAAPKVLALCADDYGASHGVCEGILELIGSGRLSATSVLAGGPAWPGRAAELAALSAVREGRVQVGLHFNLTEGSPLSPALAAQHPQGFGLGELIVKAHVRRLPVPALTAEWRSQWQAFVQAFGRAPDYVDGHQHVHHLPQVREVVLSELMPVGTPAVRATGHLCGPGHGFKRWVIEASGGAALQRQLQRLKWRHNTTLWGAYDFVEPDYRGLMRQWLHQMPAQGALLFCHPGCPTTGPLDGHSDPIAAAREREWRYLRSDAFAEDLQEMGVRLGQAW